MILETGSVVAFYQMDNERLPPLSIVWGDATEKNINQLQRLNSTIFPVKYSDQFYKEAIKARKGFVKLAYFNELLVGAVCCRKEPYVESKASISKKQSQAPPQAPSENSRSSLYIMTLGVLAPYRERGIGTQLLNHVLDLVSSSPYCKDVYDIYLHVQEGNEDALQFYQKYGFEVSEKIEKYYMGISPPDCLIVQKVVQRTES